MARQSEQVRQALRERSAEFRRLEQEHSSYSQQLEALTRKARPAADEQAEIARLKKRKLQAKDRMAEMVRDYRREQAEAVQAT